MTSAKGFEIGDIVYLKSGSPSLTVGSIVPADQEEYPGGVLILCQWISTDGEHHTAWFNPACLIKKDPHA